MRMTLQWWMAMACASSLACSSEPLDSNAGSGGQGGNGGTPAAPSRCSAALRQSLSLVDEVSTAEVKVLSEDGDERTWFVDASVGGIDGEDSHPWIYLSLGSGKPVAVTDLSAFDSTAWDLALKRTMVRTNSGDSGPGQGGAIRIALPWEKVSRATLGNKSLPSEDWFDEDCMLELDATNNLVTTYSGWSEYDEAHHIVSAAPDVVYVTAGGDGSLYKVQILDYYSTPNGSHGNVAGRYRLRSAPLP